MAAEIRPIERQLEGVECCIHRPTAKRQQTETKNGQWFEQAKRAHQRAKV